MVVTADELDNSFSAKNWPTIINIAKGGTCGALTLQVWVLISGFAEEVNLIWRQGQLTATLLYVWLRYLPLAFQIFNLVIDEYLYVAHPHPKLCLLSLLTKIVSSQLILVGVEIVMLIRVYILYNRGRRIKYFLATIYTIGLSLQMFANTLIISHLHKSERACLVEPAHWVPLLIFSAGTGITQGTLITMTCLHTLKARQWAWLRMPLTGMMLRDAFVVFGVLLVLVSTISTIEIVEHLPMPFWNAAYAWYISILSIAGCQLILGIQRLIPPVTNGSSEGIQLTSVVLTDLF
ncbi:hypothetical protein P691DRAFT_129798 [Macrolepiota fuliginosa MF-IS2]|uniref:DUF6533 domain-containing protein n=1 Tax=Macrolepiota fuliginosa MF-IS2 TaxID=1400762 RepID=A0A9P5X9F6_9AGAR|nr:hypothetical protein P691DRAFT_129798 [Macrolepiota fuliginosa MF-IS2]